MAMNMPARQATPPAKPIRDTAWPAHAAGIQAIQPEAAPWADGNALLPAVWPIVSTRRNRTESSFITRLRRHAKTTASFLPSR